MDCFHNIPFFERELSASELHSNVTQHCYCNHHANVSNRDTVFQSIKTRHYHRLVELLITRPGLSEALSALLCYQCLFPQAVSKSQFKTRSKTCTACLLFVLLQHSANITQGSTHSLMSPYFPRSLLRTPF